MSELVGSPGNSASMVSIGCSKEGGLTELFFERFRSEDVVGKLADIFPCLLCDVTCHGKGSAKDIKSIESESIGFILDVK